MSKVKLLLYCTKAKPLLWKSRETARIRNIFYIGTKEWFKDELLNGKIVAECEVETEKIECRFEDDDFGGNYIYSLEKSENVDFGAESCLDFDRLNEYLKGENGYALHISNVNIFDKPKELKDIYTRECNWDKCSKCKYGKDGNIDCCTIDIPLAKAPKNMMWVWHKGERKVLISIRPQHLCNILNSRKTIEVRKKILKGM